MYDLGEPNGGGSVDILLFNLRAVTVEVAPADFRHLCLGIVFSTLC